MYLITLRALCLENTDPARNALKTNNYESRIDDINSGTRRGTALLMPSDGILARKKEKVNRVDP